MVYQRAMLTISGLSLYRGVSVVCIVVVDPQVLSMRDRRTAICGCLLHCDDY